MDVFLVPIGATRHELYCEVPDGAADHHADEAAGPGFIRRLSARFQAMLAAADGRGGHESRDTGLWGRLRDRLLRWVAERIAEQRLLWHLRRRHEATLVHPEDLPSGDALGIMRAALQRDADRHVKWMVVCVVGLVVSGALAIIPGPNVIAYYFAFRVVGHYLSTRGARQGLHRTVWATRASADLTALRRAAGLESPHREQQVHDVAARLQLQHLAAFLERMVPRSA